MSRVATLLDRDSFSTSNALRNNCRNSFISGFYKAGRRGRMEAASRIPNVGIALWGGTKQHPLNRYAKRQNRLKAATCDLVNDVVVRGGWYCQRTGERS